MFVGGTFVLGFVSSPSEGAQPAGVRTFLLGSACLSAQGFRGVGEFGGHGRTVVNVIQRTWMAHLRFSNIPRFGGLGFGSKLLSRHGGGSGRRRWTCAGSSWRCACRSGDPGRGAGFRAVRLLARGQTEVDVPTQPFVLVGSFGLTGAAWQATDLPEGLQVAIGLQQIPVAIAGRATWSSTLSVASASPTGAGRPHHGHAR